jgi:hypothetical protein
MQKSDLLDIQDNLLEIQDNLLKLLRNLKEVRSTLMAYCLIFLIRISEIVEIFLKNMG